MIVLGIESSCDETAAAVVCAERGILSNVLLSQLKEHRAFGGVVPEIAARTHLDYMDTLIRAAMEEAGIGFDGLDGVAATAGPGLIGGVMVGMMAGKAIAAARGLPFVAVNHLEAHALTPRLTDKVEFPYLVLLVSGGHTQILVAEDVGVYRRWGTTLDDALGECFDKSARAMGFPYPGGPPLEKAARTCADPAAALARFPLPRPMKGRPGCDFSFSGLKTAVRQHVDNFPESGPNAADIADLAYSFHLSVKEILIDRCRQAIQRFFVAYGDRIERPVLVVSGGVAANGILRDGLKELTAETNTGFIAPPLALCSDNGAMIAWVGVERLTRGISDPLDVPARPRWPLDPEAEPRPGAGVKA